MKLLHLGDLHIGKSVNDYSMIEDQKYILHEILMMIDKYQVDGVLIAGDVYDKAVPSEEAVGVLDGFLCQLAERQVKTYMISGNHDSDERLHFGSALFETNGIYICSKYRGELYKQTAEDEYGKVNLYLLPFVKVSQVRHFFPEEEIETYDQAVDVILKHASINKKERNILIAHQFVVGSSEEPRLGGSENASVQQVGTIEKISSDRFALFDYVALGHIHSPQRIGRDTIRYCGSPLKYSLSEVHSEKSVPMLTLGKKGTLDMEFLPLRPRRNMRHLKGRLEQLLDKNNITDTDDYIYVTLTDEIPIPDAMAMLRQYYPNMMKLDYENSRTKGAETIDITRVTREKSFPELISEFYHMMCGCDMEEKERKILLEAAKEAGVIDETS
ncbi:MAG: exonuclease SbcCD subunit D [Bacteroides sp.]|nr:exonuclease SbcCD subunit D [Bacteroides sp.]MCM1549287.1 exonuclease SbcCD subunit D [Clostridium sp.]